MRKTIAILLALVTLMCFGSSCAESETFTPSILKAADLTLSQWMSTEETRNMLAGYAIMDMCFEGGDSDLLFEAISDDAVYVVKYDNLTIGIVLFAHEQMQWLMYTPSMNLAKYQWTDFNESPSIMMEEIKKEGIVESYYTVDKFDVLDSIGTILKILNAT